MGIFNNMIKSQNLYISTHLPVEKILHCDINHQAQNLSSTSKQTPWKILSGTLSEGSAEEVFAAGQAHKISTPAAAGSNATIMRTISHVLLTNYSPTTINENIAIQFDTILPNNLQVGDYITVQTYPFYATYVKLRVNTIYVYDILFDIVGYNLLGGIETNVGQLKLYSLNSPKHNIKITQVFNIKSKIDVTSKCVFSPLEIYVNNFCYPKIPNNTKEYENLSFADAIGRLQQVRAGIYTAFAIAKSMTIPNLIIYKPLSVNQ